MVRHDAYPLHAITQRPMVMYHSWDSQNAWLRQIIAENYLYMNARTAARAGLADDDWVWVDSPHGRLRCRMNTMEGCEPNTVWTWNAIGKQAGAWGLDADAPEATDGFPAQSPDRASICRAATGSALPIPIRSPGRLRGSTCGRLRKCSAGEAGSGRVPGASVAGQPAASAGGAALLGDERAHER